MVISLAGLVAPFALGLVTAPWFHAQLSGPLPPLTGFRLFFAVAMSITAIPILGRILMELGLSHTRTAALTIGAAAIDHLTGWLLLGVVSLLVFIGLFVSAAITSNLGVFAIIGGFAVAPTSASSPAVARSGCASWSAWWPSLASSAAPTWGRAPSVSGRARRSPSPLA